MSKTLHPANVRKLDALWKLRRGGFSGPDCGLHICLEDYGIVWRELAKPYADGTKWVFVYRIDADAGVFDRASYSHDTVPTKEWNWVKWDDVSKTFGIITEEFLTQPFTVIVYNLYLHYGYENVFGTTYREGFHIAGISKPKFELVNLDDEVEAEDYIRRVGTGVRPGARVGLKSHRVAKDLRNYAHNKLTAMGLRKRGDIAQACQYEAICGNIYDGLPKEVRW